jgi:aquaporin Z
MPRPGSTEGRLLVKNWQKYAAEVYGTFVLVLFGTGAILATGGDPVGIALGFGLALVAGLYTVGRVSGGHFNPAVSLAAFLDRRMDLNDMLAYWVFQLVGAVLASLTLAFVTSKEFVAITINAMNSEVDAFAGFVWEGLLTAVFVMAILVLTKGRGTRARLLGIGLTLTAVHLAGLGISGASVNPARSFGPALVSGEWTDIWVYIAGPVAGAILAWVLYKVIITGDLDFTVGSTSPAAAAPAAKAAPARRATTPAKRPATAARKPAARKPAPKKN